MRQCLWWRCAFVAIALCLSDPAAAIDLEKLVMPGLLIDGHAEWEGDCGACHPRLRDTTQRALCLECHDAVAADLQAGAGFHGLSPNAARSACRTCHVDHLGREADVVNLDTASFDHAFTDYPLRGAHMRVDCDLCHEPAGAFRETSSDCVSCHREDDAHAGALGPECGDCHTEDAWPTAVFDHAATRFPLLGEHTDVACALCHPGQRFESTAMDCNSCHRVDDVHRGRFGSKCADCHTSESWKKQSFDHGRETRFGLNGAHQSLDCEACHTQGLGVELPRDCLSCHGSDDVHRGRNGSDCNKCHGETSWKDASFDHNRETKFPLLGAHSDVKCERCHTGRLDESPPATRCGACHALDDPHAGQLGDGCEACHNEETWSHEIFFEHDMTSFPLLGMHAVASCAQCHVTSRFKDASADCWACHATDDKHLRRLGTDCALCHNPNSWQRWHFDHETRTSFPLTGAHAELDCHTCHRLPADPRIEVSSSCESCHARDDRHSGAFGSDCARCHNDVAWDQVDMESLR